MIELDEYRESAALSAGGRLWQSARWRAIITVVVGLGMIPAAIAVPGGRLGTMKRGNYGCEIAGDAMGEPGIRQAAQDFTILHSSIYSTAAGRGSYLMTGDFLTMTTGPRRGERYKRISENFLRRLNADGEESTLRCIRLATNTP